MSLQRILVRVALIRVCFSKYPSVGFLGAILAAVTIVVCALFSVMVAKGWRILVVISGGTSEALAMTRLIK
jgi:hypothetical protein